MKQLITTSRIRSIIAGTHTEKDAAAALRQHRIRYTFSTEGGTFHIRVPSRSGCVRIIRTASRSAPLLVVPVPATGYPALFRLPVPMFHHDY